MAHLRVQKMLKKYVSHKRGTLGYWIKCTEKTLHIMRWMCILTGALLYPWVQDLFPRSSRSEGGRDWWLSTANKTSIILIYFFRRKIVFSFIHLKMIHSSPRPTWSHLTYSTYTLTELDWPVECIFHLIATKKEWNINVFSTKVQRVKHIF